MALFLCLFELLNMCPHENVCKVTSFYLIYPLLKLKVCVKLLIIFHSLRSKMNVKFPSTILWKEAVFISIDRSFARPKAGAGINKCQ